MESKHKSDYGQWKLTAGKFYGDPEKDKGNFNNPGTLMVTIIYLRLSFGHFHPTSNFPVPFKPFVLFVHYCRPSD